MSHINWLAVIISSLLAFVIGYFWYGPFMFGPKWQKENKLTDDQLRNGNMAQLYGTALFLILFFCIILNLNLITTDKNGMADGIKHGFLISVGFICTSLGVSYLFSRRSIQLFLIDAGYFVCISVVMGAILASWS
ncbi:MAG: DUF1761 domain-containing protein [Saprospiraceae bacterium]|nr:DUF1761 domain-containing protein [Candidatus Vicinibacter affinis]